MRLLTLGLLCLVIATGCNNEKTLFTSVPSEDSGITFTNQIDESDSLNILKNEYLYNGGGVGLADFNNDGLVDIFFSGNVVASEFYLNKGNLQFDNVTETSRINLDDQWSSGVAIIDINNDGWKDIYVCGTNSDDPLKRMNKLWINNGNNVEGVCTFKEEASAYGLADTSHTTQAAFFDYDKDGLMDVFLIINERQSHLLPNKYTSQSGEQIIGQADKLLKGKYSDELGHLVFEDVSESAGITERGFSLGIGITDFNKDGWSDIYISNDFLTSDVAYVNNGDGTFTNRSKEYFRHTSYSAMGNTVADINNDGLMDVVAVDMLPEDNYRRKKMLNDNNYTAYQNFDKFGYQHQYVRNTLQLNTGLHAENKEPTFIEVAFHAGISGTDWSWTPMAEDFDLDGDRDLIITNGFPKDITDQDFVAYQRKTSRYVDISQLLQSIPEVKIKNYAFRNNGDLTFEEVTSSWGITENSFSNGAAFADLDNDGDLDYVVNNINDPAFLFKNNAVSSEDQNLATKLLLNGPANNASGIGAKYVIFKDQELAYYGEVNPYKGYLSSTFEAPLFSSSLGDELLVIWPDNSFQRLPLDNSLASITVDYKESKAGFDYEDYNDLASSALVERVDLAFVGLSHKDSVLDFNDFNVQKLLIKKLSNRTAKFSIEDFDGDGDDDIYFNGSNQRSGTFFLQNDTGGFTQSDLIDGPYSQVDQVESTFLDINGDQKLDLILSSGGNELAPEGNNYQDQVFINDNGRLKKVANVLPEIAISTSCVAAADYDKDGDLDLFVGAGAVVDQYPLSQDSYLLENISSPGNPKYKIAQKLSLGLVNDAEWVDLNQNGTLSLFTVGEFETPKLLRFDGGNFSTVSIESFNGLRGLWTCLKTADLDGDGKLDIIVGNVGTNSLVTNRAKPFKYYFGDFDADGAFDAIPTSLFKDKNGVAQEFPYFGRQDMRKQMNKMAKVYISNESYAFETMEGLFTKFEVKDYESVEASYFKSVIFWNNGNDEFEYQLLPLEFQLSMINDFLVYDVNQDGRLDILAAGNNYGIETGTGRLDAYQGGVLLGDSNRTFTYKTATESNFLANGYTQMIDLLKIGNTDHILLSRENDTPLLYKSKIQR